MNTEIETTKDDCKLVKRSRFEVILELIAKEMLHFPACDMPIVNRFLDGMYSREIFAPANSITVSVKHKKDHFIVISQGSGLFYDEYGCKKVCAPCTMVTKAGTQRLIFIKDDMIATTFHRTDETNPDKIMDVIAEPFEFGNQTYKAISEEEMFKLIHKEHNELS